MLVLELQGVGGWEARVQASRMLANAHASALRVRRRLAHCLVPVGAQAATCLLDNLELALAAPRDFPLQWDANASPRVLRLRRPGCD